MALTSREWWIIGITTTISFFLFSEIGRSLAISGYKLTASEVKKLEKRARERAKKEEKAIAALR